METPRKIGTLFRQHGKAIAISFKMARLRLGPLQLHLGVKSFERQNRKPVKHKARCLRVQRRGRVGQSAAVKSLQQDGIDPLDKIVAPLVRLIDGPFQLCDVCCGGMRVACGIFAVPQIIVGPVQVLYQRHQIVPGPRIGGAAVPACRKAIKLV